MNRLSSFSWFVFATSGMLSTVGCRAMPEKSGVASNYPAYLQGMAEETCGTDNVESVKVESYDNGIVKSLSFSCR